MSTTHREAAHGSRRRCTAQTETGAPCRMAPLAGSEPARCFNHAPERAPDRARARRLGGEARRSRALYVLGPEADQLRSVEGIRAVLEVTVHEARHLPPGHERSRAIFAGLTLALRCLEVGAIEERLAALEEQIATNPGPRRMA